MTENREAVAASRRCIICNALIMPRRREPGWKYERRTTCGSAKCIAAGKHSRADLSNGNGKWWRTVRPWPEGMAFADAEVTDGGQYGAPKFPGSAPAASPTGCSAELCASSPMAGI
jgi:hypothetical protein